MNGEDSAMAGLTGEALSAVAGLDWSGNTISLLICAVLGPLAGGGRVSC